MMINPSDSYKTQIEKQQKIIAALMHQHERRQGMAGSAYALFRSAMELESQVRKKTEDLEQALYTIGERNIELQNIYSDHKRDQQSLADTLEVMNQGYALLKEGYLAVVNDRFRGLFPDVSAKLYVGASADDFLSAIASSDALDILTDPEREEWKQGRMKALSAERTNFVLPIKGDRWFNVSYQRTSLGNMAIMQSEITDLVRTNRAEKNQIIGENEILLQAVFEHLSLAVCLVSKDGKIKTCNQRFLEILDVQSEELAAANSVGAIVERLQKADMLKDEVSRQNALEWSLDLEKGRTVRRRLEMSSGMIIDMKLVALPDNDLIVTFDDVTEETKAKEALVEANERLEERVAGRTAALMAANKQLKEKTSRQAEVERQLVEAKNLAEAANLSKTRFLAAASHDLLQPINAVKLYISTLKDVVRSRETRSLSEKISASFDSVESLLQSLLEMSRLEGNTAKFNMTEFCIDDILSQLMVDFAPQAGIKGLKLHVVQSQKWVYSDKTYLRRIISNLVNNAIEYTETGRVLVGCRLKGGRLRIEVWDTGIGISKKDHQLIFEEFHRVSETGDTKGMGLGLSIVERACNKLGHELTMRSKPGVGSVFAVEVENVEIHPDGRGSGEQEQIHLRNSIDGLIAIVVENDENVLTAMTQKLESWGVSVLPARSTETALLALKQVGMPPDIVIADFQLDDEDNGFETIAALRAASSSDLPALIVTGNQNAELEIEAEARGIELLRKPVPVHRLRALIDWKTRQESHMEVGANV